MSINLGSLTGAKEQAALDAWDKAKTLLTEILALQVTLYGEEDQSLRNKLDWINANIIQLFLLEGLKIGLKSTLNEWVQLKGALLRAQDALEAALDNEGTTGTISGDENSVESLLGPL